MRITPEKILFVRQGEIFVFGSNEAGIHGGGAAWLAEKRFGAKYGVGFGLQGRSFAIPTKDWNINTLPLNVIRHYVNRFIAFTKLPRYRYHTFFVTEIGCGLAGLEPYQIAPMFRTVLNQSNIALPQRFIDFLTEDVDITPWDPNRV